MSSSSIESLLHIFGGQTVVQYKKPNKDFFFSKKALPNIRAYNPTVDITDPDILKLKSALIKETLAHRHYLFWRDNTTSTFAHMLVAAILGEGIKVEVRGDENATTIIEHWNDEVNEKHQTIEDVLGDIIIDNIIDAQSLWRIWKNPNAENWEPIVDIQRVSMDSVQIETHETRGTTRFIQRLNVPVKPFSKREFYNRPSTEALYVDSKYVEIIIPNEHNCCIYFSLFDSPPLNSILPLLVIKRWSYFFLRKFLEKHWAPYVVGYVGDPKNGYMPTTEQDQKDAISWAAEVIRKIRDFGGGAMLATTKLEVLNTNSDKIADNYINVIEHLNKQIVLGVYGTMSIRESQGKSTKGGQDIAQQSFLRTLRMFRQSLAVPFKRFFSYMLLPAYGVNGKKPEDIVITFPMMNLYNVKEVLESVEIGSKIGAFKSIKEVRKILNTIWSHIDEKISKEEEDKMERTFIELNAPSRAPEDNPLNRTKGIKTKIPAEKKKV